MEQVPACTVFDLGDTGPIGGVVRENTRERAGVAPSGGGLDAAWSGGMVSSAVRRVHTIVAEAMRGHHDV